MLDGTLVTREMLHVLLGRGLLPRRHGAGVGAAGEVGAVAPLYRLCTVHSYSTVQALYSAEQRVPVLCPSIFEMSPKLLRCK